MPYTVSKNMFSNAKMESQTHKTSENYAYLGYILIIQSAYRYTRKLDQENVVCNGETH